MVVTMVTGFVLVWVSVDTVTYDEFSGDAVTWKRLLPLVNRLLYQILSCKHTPRSGLSSSTG